MAEVLCYAIPFFVLLLVAEYMAFRHLGDHDGDYVGFEARDNLRNPKILPLRRPFPWQATASSPAARS